MKVAACLSGGARAPRQDLQTVIAMLDAMDIDAKRGRPAPRGVVEVEGGALGWLHTSDRFSPLPLLRQGGDGNLLLVSGAPISCSGDLESALESALRSSLDEAARSLESLDGGFAALRWDARSRRLLVVGDVMGFQPLHVGSGGSDTPLLLATEAKALAATGLVDTAPDPLAWGSFLSMGNTFGNRSFLTGVHRMASGISHVFAPSSGNPSLPESSRVHWEWPEPRRVSSVAEVDLSEHLGAFMRSVKGYGEYGQHGAVLMSGGFDSRLVLCLALHAGLRPVALVVKHTDEHADAEGKLAARIARRLGVQVEEYEPSADFYLTDSYRRYIELNELANPSLGLFIARVSQFINGTHAAVWEGQAPNMLRTFSRNPDSKGFDAFLERARHAPDSHVARATRRMFGEQWLRECTETLAQAIDEARSTFTDDEFGVLQFNRLNRARNRIATNAFGAFGHDALPFCPGLTHEFFARNDTLTGKVKGGNRLQVAILRKYFPEALAEPFVSGGKLVDPSGEHGAWLRVATLRERLSHGKRPARLLAPLLGARRTSFPVDEAAARLFGDDAEGSLLDDPRLDRDGVRSTINPPADLRGDAANVQREARSILFYWLAAREIVGMDTERLPATTP